MTLEEAREKMRGLLSERDELYRQHGLAGNGPGITSEDTELNKALHDVHERERRLGFRLASYPHIRPHLWCWMVDVHGTESNLCSEEAFEEGLHMLHESDKAGFAARAGGSLGQLLVHDFISRELGMRITDTGGGCGGWHIGTPCDQVEMESLTASLHAKFAKAIAAGLLEVRVKFWNWRFKEQRT